MAKSAPQPEEDEGAEKATVDRDTELSDKEEYAEALEKLSGIVEDSFNDQIPRTNAQYDFWDVYECDLNDNQAYNGNSQAFIPFVRDSIDARKTRFTGQMFPISGRYVEVVTENGDIPHAEMALVEHYINRAKIRTEIAPALCVNGDVEGQYSLYVTWDEIERHVVSKEYEEEDGVATQKVKASIVLDAGPAVECIPDADIVVYPATSDSIDAALRNGGFVAITRRWSQAKIDRMIEDGEITKEAGEGIMADMMEVQEGRRDIKKEHAHAVGVKTKGTWYLAREVWSMLEVDGDMRVSRSYFGAGEHTKLGTKLNPYWCDLCPIISGPVKKISGSFKGQSQVKPVAKLQYLANDFLNQAADSATYSMMPIVMTDPNKNPKTSTMILDLAAVWEVDPNSTQFAKFPELWKSGFELVNALKAQIQQSLGVNPAMIPSSGGKKTQADVANEQAVDLLTTADAVVCIESVFTQMVQRFVSYDMQFRHDDLLIPMFGMMGKRAKMERIPPIQDNNRYQYRWLGVEAARNAAQIQQQVAMINVIKGIPPQMYRDHRLDLTAMLENLVENAMGPRLAPLTFVSLKDELAMDQDEENKILLQGFEVPISPLDNDQEHLQKLTPLLNLGPEGDPTGNIQLHARKHMMAMQQKAMQAAQASQGMIPPAPPGQPGQPQGPPGAPPQGPPGMQASPGPREGAQPGQTRMQGPPGMIHADRLPAAGAIQMPRKAS